MTSSHVTILNSVTHTCTVEVWNSRRAWHGRLLLAGLRLLPGGAAGHLLLLAAGLAPDQVTLMWSAPVIMLTLNRSIMSARRGLILSAGVAAMGWTIILCAALVGNLEF